MNNYSLKQYAQLDKDCSNEAKVVIDPYKGQLALN